MQTLIAIGLGALAYLAAMLVLDARGRLPSWMTMSGPLTIFETDRFPAAIDRLAVHRRFWRRLTDAGVVTSMVLLVASMGMVVLAGYIAVTREVATEVNRPRNALAVPGINDFLPLAATVEIVIGLFVGIAIHELAHALLARVEGIDVDSMGLIFLTIVPFGAFVDMSGEEESASTAVQNRIYAAGITANLLVAIGCGLVLIALVATSVAAVPGLAVAGVVPGTPADDADIERGDVLTAIDGVETDSQTAFDEQLTAADDTITVDRADGEAVTVNRSVVVTGGPEAGPNTIEPRTQIASVNDTSVTTVADAESELEAASERDPAVPVTVVGDDGTEQEETVYPGAFATSVVEDGPLADAGAPADEPGVVTSIDGQQLLTHEDMTEALAAAEAGETVPVGFATEDGHDSYEVTLGEASDGGARLGVVPQAGTGGLLLTDFGVDAYPADEHLAVLSGEAGATSLTNTPVDRLLGLSLLPFAGMIGLFTENFGGFVGSVANFYTVTGPLSIADGSVFFFATVLLWTGWFSLLMGVFNCLPAYPLDGGRLIKTNVGAIATHFEVADPDRVGTLVAGTATAIAVIAVLAVLFGPMIL